MLKEEIKEHMSIFLQIQIRKQHTISLQLKNYSVVWGKGEMRQCPHILTLRRLRQLLEK